MADVADDGRSGCLDEMPESHRPRFGQISKGANKPAGDRIACRKANFQVEKSKYMKRIVSAVPGRLRIKDHQFADEAVIERVVAELKAHLPVDGVRANARAGSVVISYPVSKISPEDMRRRTGEILGRLLGRGSRARGRSVRLHLNQASKVIGVGSLAASLAFALTRYKQLHIVTGWVFVASVVVHMAVFRRTLLK